MSLWINETFINATNGYIFHQDPDFQESWTDNRGKLFRALQREYGRCEGKIYRDRPKRFDGPNNPIPVGYVFRKKEQYEGYVPRHQPEYYIKETWVEIQERENEEF